VIFEKLNYGPEKSFRICQKFEINKSIQAGKPGKAI
jgi:hypothetical protein